MAVIHLVILACFFKMSFENTIDMYNNTTQTHYSCNNFPEVKNGIVILKKSLMADYSITAHIECEMSYELLGPPKILCFKGHWEEHVHPQCIARCKMPPLIPNGAVSIEGVKDENNMFGKGARATYACLPGFQLTPPESVYRECKKGNWSGVAASCVLKVCKQPENILNGYIIEKFISDNYYDVGHQVHYGCNSGYKLQGNNIQTCLEDGIWAPKAPKCVLAGEYLYFYYCFM